MLAAMFVLPFLSFWLLCAIGALWVKMRIALKRRFVSPFGLVAFSGIVAALVLVPNTAFRGFSFAIGVTVLMIAPVCLTQLLLCLPAHAVSRRSRRQLRGARWGAWTALALGSFHWYMANAGFDRFSGWPEKWWDYGGGTITALVIVATSYLAGRVAQGVARGLRKSPTLLDLTSS